MVPPMMSTIILSILFHFLLCHSWLAFGHAILPRADPSLPNIDSLLRSLDVPEQSEIINNNDNGHTLQPAVLFPESSQTQQDEFRQVIPTSSSPTEILLLSKYKLVTRTFMYNDYKNAIAVMLANTYTMKSERIVLVIGSEGFWIFKIKYGAEELMTGMSPDQVRNSNAFRYAIRELVFGEKIEATIIKKLKPTNAQETLTEYLEELDARFGKVRSVLFIDPTPDHRAPHFPDVLAKSVLDFVKPLSDSLKFHHLRIKREVTDDQSHNLRVDAFQGTYHGENAQIVVASYGSEKVELAVFPDWSRVTRKEVAAVAASLTADPCDEFLNYDWKR